MPGPTLPLFDPPPAPPSSAPPARLLAIDTIYLEPAAAETPDGRAILEQLPDARRIEVASHWRIPELHGDPARAPEWLAVKRNVLVLGLRKAMTIRENGRSADYIAPGLSTGCAMACTYCYVPRRKGHANPITLLVNTEAMLRAVERHAAKLGPKQTPNQCHPSLWVYDIGENGDASVDAYLHPGVAATIERFGRIPNAMASFATKHVNRDLLKLDPRGHTRVRFGLMPDAMARRVDVRCDPIPARIAAIDDFVRAGYEVHVNLSPVILADGWQADYAALFDQIADTVPARSRAQLKAEIIMLTHDPFMHDVNRAWHPKGEAAIWQPDLQVRKRTQGGAVALRYKNDVKARALDELKGLLHARLPGCAVRYAF